MTETDVLVLTEGQRKTDHRISQAHDDLANGQREIIEDVHGAASNIIREVSNDTQFLQAGQDRLGSEVNRGFTNAARDSAVTDRTVLNSAYGVDKNVDGNFRWLSHEDREFERHQSAQLRDLSLGQAGTDNRVSDAAFRSEINDNNNSYRVQDRLGDLERRIDNRISDADRRTELAVQKAHDTVQLEAERTRESAIKNELETRLYLRDREDRTEDLVRQLADRNLDEMRGFERRSRDDEGRTRDLIRHIDEERAERAYLKSSLSNLELKTELAIERALRHRHHDDDGIRFDPRINIVLEDIDEEERPRRRRSRESSQTV